jgi:hypothetical protein
MRTGILGAFALASAWLAVGGGPASADPAIVGIYQDRLGIQAAAGNTGSVTQMALGPDGRLYASRNGGGVISFARDPLTGQLSDRRAASDVNGLGVAFHAGRREMYLSANDSIWRLTDDDGDGNWGEAGETRVAIVTNLPIGRHTADQIQIRGDTLYIGIGHRTMNGTTGPDDGFGGDNFGESAYNGTVSMIRDLSAVPSVTDAARLLGAPDQATIQADDSPFTSTAVDKLVVHSAGTRNPYGLGIDRDGHLYFSNNHNRANTNGDGTSTLTSGADPLDSDFSDDVHDQFFRAEEGADYGFRNENWRGDRDPSVIAAMLDPSDPDYNRVRSITPDNLFSDDPNSLELHDPANPVGLGPSASANGFDFWYAPGLGGELYGDAFLARFTGTIREASPGTDALTYRDLVAIDPITGEVRRVAFGFNSPLAVLAAGPRHLYVADFSFNPGSGGTIYLLTAAIPEPSSLLLAAMAAPAVAVLGLRRRRRRRGRPDPH